MRRLSVLAIFSILSLSVFVNFVLGRNEKPSRSREKILLPQPQMEGMLSLEQVLAKRRSVRQFKDAPMMPGEIAQLAWAGQGITDKTRGFRTAPSAGAIYPMQLYFATEEGLFVYDSAEHSLARRLNMDVRRKLANAALRQQAVMQAGCDIIIAGSVRKVAAKYGGNARRYLLLEAGHIAQNIVLQAVAMDLGAVTIGAFDKKSAARICRLGKELEPLYIICVGHITAAAGAAAREDKSAYVREQAPLKRAVLIVASADFRDEELFETKSALENAGIQTVTASRKLGVVRGMLGGVARAVVALDQLRVDDFDAVVFIGGTGAAEYFGNFYALRIVREAAAKKKIVAAICVAPTILANAGLLQGVKATSFSSERRRLTRAGAEFTGSAVERDGLIITANGPKAAAQFGQTIVEALQQQAQSGPAG